MSYYDIDDDGAKAAGTLFTAVVLGAAILGSKAYDQLLATKKNAIEPTCPNGGNLVVLAENSQGGLAPVQVKDGKIDLAAIKYAQNVQMSCSDGPVQLNVSLSDDKNETHSCTSATMHCTKSSIIPAQDANGLSLKCEQGNNIKASCNDNDI